MVALTVGVVRRVQILILVVRLKGGLGNQLFSYAAARRVAMENNAELVLDTVSGFKRDFLYKRQFDLESFNITARHAFPQERYEPFERVRRGIAKFQARRVPLNGRSYIEQEHSEFDARVLDIKLTNKVNTIDGLWQSEFYFADIADTLRWDLQMSVPLSSTTQKIAEVIQNQNAVCVHFRCFGEQDTEANSPSSYYLQAVARAKKLLKDPKFYVFSDDIEAARAFLPTELQSATFVDWNVGRSGQLADFWLMRQFNNFIIANSTFSWWAAWLADGADNGFVIYPRCLNKEKYQWAWDYEGQMPAKWLSVIVQ